MKVRTLFVAAAVAVSSVPAKAATLEVDLTASRDNPSSPQMGDHLTFHTTIRNQGSEPVDGLIAWLSLVEVDSGREQPVDLEDWSAHKAITVPSLAPGQAVETDWPMRLIQAGDYRVVVSAVSRRAAALTPSPFADFTVRSKAVVESRRVLPVALGVPALIAASLLLGRRRESRSRVA